MKKLFFIVAYSYFPLYPASTIDPKVTKEEIIEYEHKLISGNTLEVIATSGKISISGWDKETIYVRATKRAPEKLLSSLNIEAHLTDTSALIRTLSDPAPTYTYSYSFLFFNYSYTYTCPDGCMSVDYKIKIPRTTAIKITSTKNSPLRVKNIDHGVWIKNNKGDIKTDEIAGPLEIQTENSDIQITDSNNKISLQVTHGDISINNSLSVSIEGKNGNIDVNNVQGALAVKTKQGHIKANNIAQAATINVSQGDVYLTNVHGPIAIHSKRGYVKVQKAKSACTITTVNGNITLSQKSCKPEENIDLQSTHGDIRLYILKHLDAHLKAETEGGAISLDRSLTEVYHVAQNVKNLDISLGKKDSQGSQVTVKTIDGNIKIASY